MSLLIGICIVIELGKGLIKMTDQQFSSAKRLKPLLETALANTI